MNTEIQFIIVQLKDAYDGEPWFGRPVKALLAEVNEETAFQNPSGQHSMLELLWHMITWREFTVDRLQHSPQMRMEYFEENDWRPLDVDDRTLWPQGLERLQETQDQLLSLLQKASDDLLVQQVRERSYDFRKLLHGMIQHDIYHAGQIAYLMKMSSAKRRG